MTSRILKNAFLQIGAFDIDQMERIGKEASEHLGIPEENIGVFCPCAELFVLWDNRKRRPALTRILAAVVQAKAEQNV